MKTTIDIPDELYRRVKARSARERRPVRAVTVQLLQEWLDSAPEPQDEPAATPPAVEPQIQFTEAQLDAMPWLRITRKYVRPGMSHDLDEMREAIARGWGASYAEKNARCFP